MFDTQHMSSSNVDCMQCFLCTLLVGWCVLFCTDSALWHAGILQWTRQLNPCTLLMSFRCIKAFMHAFSGRFSRTCLEGISFNFFVCFIFNVSLGSAPKRKNFDIQRNTGVGSGGQFTSNRLSRHQKHILENTYSKKSIFQNIHIFTNCWQNMSNTNT